jgi:sugar lactone lactonase YvrE
MYFHLSRLARTLFVLFSVAVAGSVHAASNDVTLTLVSGVLTVTNTNDDAAYTINDFAYNSGTNKVSFELTGAAVITEALAAVTVTGTQGAQTVTVDLADASVATAFAGLKLSSISTKFLNAQVGVAGINLSSVITGAANQGFNLSDLDSAVDNDTFVRGALIAKGTGDVIINIGTNAGSVLTVFTEGDITATTGTVSITGHSIDFYADVTSAGPLSLSGTGSVYALGLVSVASINVNSSGGNITLRNIVTTTGATIAGGSAMNVYLSGIIVSGGAFNIGAGLTGINISDNTQLILNSATLGSTFASPLVVTGSGTFKLLGVGTLTLSADSSAGVTEGDTINVTNATLNVTGKLGSLSTVTLTNGTLTGPSGTVGILTLGSGTVIPRGTLNTAAVSFSVPTTYSVGVLTRTTASNLKTASAINLGGATLTVHEVATGLSVNNTFTIINNTAVSGTVAGIFAGLPQGTTIATTDTAGNAVIFEISYVGGTNSNDVTLKVVGLAPNAPTSVSALSGNGQAVVSFTAPVGNGGTAVTSYTVTATPVGGGTAVIASGSSSPITVTGLTNGTAYTFTVKATNSVGTGSASSASSSAIPVTVPGAPTAASGVSGNTQAIVSFTAPVSNGGASITSYTVTATPSDGGAAVTATGSTSPITVTGLTNWTAYTFTVTATTSVGTGSASSALSLILPVVITTQPINLTVAQGYPASFTVAASGTVPLSYQWLKNNVAISGATSATYSIATVAATDAASYTVIITNAAGSLISSAATLTVQAFNVLAANQNVIAGKSAAFMTGVNLGSTQWQVSTDAGVTWTNLSSSYTYDGVTTNVLEILKATTAMSKNRYRYQVTINNQTTTSAAGVITVGTAFLLLPVGVQVDASGNLYVSDAAGQTVRKISSDFKISTLAGNALSQGSTDGGAATAKFNEPNGLVLNTDNSLLLADTSNAALRQISTIGTVTTFAGTSGSKGSTDATGTAARFSAPVGLTRDGLSNYYIADQTNHTIRKISFSGLVTTLAGTAGQSGSVDGTGAAARFNLPTGITCNAQGDLYVSDLGSHLIRKITAAGVVTTLAGQVNVSGSSDGSGTAARFFKPAGLAIDSVGNVYVADMGNSTLRKISANGVVSTLAGLPTIDGLMDGAGSNAWFAEPQGLTLDSVGNIYVADTANAVLRKVTPEGLVTTLALAGTAPLISTQPVSLTLDNGISAMFSVLAIGDAPLSYQWKKDGTDISGAVYTSYWVSSATTFYAGNYTVAVTNAYGTTLSDTATLTVIGANRSLTQSEMIVSAYGGAVSPWFMGALGLLLLAKRVRRP